MSSTWFYVEALINYSRSFGLEKTVRKILFRFLLSVLGAVIRQSCVEVNGYRMYLIPGDKGISRELRVFRKHEPLATAILRGWLEKRMNVIDIGSNIGYYALLEAGIVGPEGRVVAIEPNPLAYQYLVKNARSFVNIITENVAIWDRDESIDFVISSWSNLSHVREIDSDPDPMGEVIKVPSKTLDSLITELCQRNGLCSVDFIRMDIEGGEVQVFRGGRNTIERFLPKIFIELHIPTIGRDRAKDILRYLRALGYYIDYMVFAGVNSPLVASPRDVMRNVDMNELISSPPMLNLHLFLNNESRSRS